MRLVILDRDGVINDDSGEIVTSAEGWVALPGSLEAIASLNQAGYRVVVASNQSGLARGLFDIDTLNRIHQKMYLELEKVGGQLDGIYFCPHRPSDNCTCRKPKPGMLEHICERFFIEPQQTVYIGDSARDLAAAKAIGMNAILVLSGKGRTTKSQLRPDDKTPVFPNLEAAVASILENAVP